MHSMTQPIDILETRLLWWDLTDLTESKVNSWMGTAFSCAEKGCRGKLYPSPNSVVYVCPSCGQKLVFTAGQLAEMSGSGNGIACCKQPIVASDPQFQEFLESDIVCDNCGAGKISHVFDADWKVKDYVAAVRLYHTAGAWRTKWFTYNLSGLVFYDQRSVRVVPVQHARDVEVVLEQAKAELILQVLPLDTFGVFGKWSKKNAKIDQLWDEAIKFPKFIASDQQAKQAVLDTVRNSILTFVRESQEKVLAKIKENGTVHKRTATALIKRLDELKRRDVWQVHTDPAVQAELDALEGLLAAQVEEE